MEVRFEEAATYLPRETPKKKLSQPWKCNWSQPLNFPPQRSATWSRNEITEGLVQCAWDVVDWFKVTICYNTRHMWSTNVKHIYKYFWHIANIVPEMTYDPLNDYDGITNNKFRAIESKSAYWFWQMPLTSHIFHKWSREGSTDLFYICSKWNLPIRLWNPRGNTRENDELRDTE